jgi:hypothetical protein
MTTLQNDMPPENDMPDNKLFFYSLVTILTFVAIMLLFGSCSPRTVPVKVVYNDLEVDTLYLKKGKYVIVKENGEFTLIYNNQIEADGIIYFEQIR